MCLLAHSRYLIRDALPSALLLHPDPRVADVAIDWAAAWGRPFEEHQHRSNRRIPVDPYLQVFYVGLFVLESTRLQIRDLLSFRGQRAVTPD